MRVENNNVSGQNHDPEQIDLIDLLGKLRLSGPQLPI